MNIRDKTIQAKCNTGDLGMRNKEKHQLVDAVNDVLLSAVVSERLAIWILEESEKRYLSSCWHIVSENESEV